jgi:hypothetical protein
MIMRNQLTRWFLFSVLLGWALSHATVFGQESGAASATHKLRQGLDKLITVDYTGQSLRDVMTHFRDKTGVPVNFDPTALTQLGLDLNLNGSRPFTTKATKEKSSQVLRRMLSDFGLTYVVFEDSLLITTEEMAFYRQMCQRVSVDLKDVPFKKAVRDLAKGHGINLVIDPTVIGRIETPVSLQVEKTGLETTLRLLAELANVKAVRMGNVVFVTHDEKAKKIRDEEQHQFENPLNPNLSALGAPPTQPMMGMGQGVLFGGGFGRMGMGIWAPLPLPEAPNDVLPNPP